MRISQCVYGNDAEKIQILAALLVVNVAAPAAHKNNRRPAIGIHQVTPGIAQNLRIRSLARSGRDFPGYLPWPRNSRLMSRSRLHGHVQCPTPAPAAVEG